MEEVKEVETSIKPPNPLGENVRVYCHKLQAFYPGTEVSACKPFEGGDRIRTALVVDLVDTPDIKAWAEKVISIYQDYESLDAIVFKVEMGNKYKTRKCAIGCDHNFIDESESWKQDIYYYHHHALSSRGVGGKNTTECIKRDKFLDLCNLLGGDSNHDLAEGRKETPIFNERKVPIVFVPNEPSNFDSESGMSVADGLKECFPSLQFSIVIKMSPELKDFLWISDHDIKVGKARLESGDNMCLFGVAPIELTWQPFGLELGDITDNFVVGFVTEKLQRGFSAIGVTVGVNVTTQEIPKEEKISSNHNKLSLFGTCICNATMLTIWFILWITVNLVPQVQIFGRALLGLKSKNLISLPNVVQFQRSDVPLSIFHSTYAKNNAYEGYEFLDTSAYVLRDHGSFGLIKDFGKRFRLRNLGNLIGLTLFTISSCVHLYLTLNFYWVMTDPKSYIGWDIPIFGTIIASVFMLAKAFVQVTGLLIMYGLWLYCTNKYFSITSDNYSTTPKPFKQENTYPWLYRPKYGHESGFFLLFGLFYSFFGFMCLGVIAWAKMTSTFSWFRGLSTKKKALTIKKSLKDELNYE